jgi:hypothetical protein
MLIRMMVFGTHITALLAAAAVTAGGVLGASSGAGTGSAERPAIVVDAAAARDGRDLVDPRLRAADAEVRLPRTAAEARIDVRYLAELGHRVVVAGPTATAAADSAGVEAVRAGDLRDALAAARP